MKSVLFKKLSYNATRITLSVLASVAVMTVVAYAASTIGTNFSADGTLSVTATSTLSSDLVVDTSTLAVDSFNNKVGIGSTSPNWKLSVAGTGSFDDNVRTSYFTATSTTATSTFAGNLKVGSGVCSTATGVGDLCVSDGLEALGNLTLNSNKSVTVCGTNATGHCDYSGTTQVAITSGISALTSGRTSKQKVIVKGNFVFTSYLNIPNYTILDLSEASITGYASSANHLIRNSDTTNGNKHIEIIGGKIDGYYQVDGVNQQVSVVNTIAMIAEGGVPASATDLTPANTGSCTLTLGTTTGIEEYGNYVVEITSNSTPDVFKWSDDGGVTWVTGVAVTGSAQSLNKGKTITFSSTTCGSLGDDWSFEPRVVYDVKIKDSTLSNTSSEAIQFNYVTDFEIDGLKCWGTGDDCLSIIHYSNNGAITNSRLQTGDSGYGGASGIEIEDGAYEITVSENVVTSGATTLTNGTCIKVIIDPGSTTLASHDIAINNNILQSCLAEGIAVLQNKAGATMYNISLNGNVIKNSGADGITVSGQSGETDLFGVSITGGGIYEAGDDGVALTQTDGVVVSGVSIFESYSNGIECSSCINTLIANNIIMNNGSGTSGSGAEYGIFAKLSTSNLKILNNMVGDNQASKTQEGVYISAATSGIVIANNDLSTIKTSTAASSLAITSASSGWANAFNNNIYKTTIDSSGTYTINNNTLMHNYVRLDCDFSANCNIALIEPNGIADGQEMSFECDDTDAQGYTCTIADSSGIVDVAGTFIMAGRDTITLRYSGASAIWLETERSDK